MEPSTQETRSPYRDIATPTYCSNCVHVHKRAYADDWKCGAEFSINPVSGRMVYTTLCRNKNKYADCSDYKEVEPEVPQDRTIRMTKVAVVLFILSVLAVSTGLFPEFWGI